MTDSETSVCGETEASCVCSLRSGHEGAHTCVCGGSWFYDDAGAFQVGSFPKEVLPGPFYEVPE